MESFAELILNEKSFIKKAELVFYLKEKKDIFFDKSAILKTEIAKIFIQSQKKYDVNENLVLTAGLLYACKKTLGAQVKEKIKAYAKESADFLLELGFDKDFCNTCLMHNRYGEIEPRSIEGDILEVSEQLGGMILDRSDRKGYQIPEAIGIINKNLNNKKNLVWEDFKDFVWKTENYYGKNEARDLTDKDTGIIGSETKGLRVINKFKNDDIRKTLTFIQEWEMKNGFMN